MRRLDYRKIWERYNGPIPKDEQGRAYEIHHIDGNKDNNSLINLICISIEDHYKIHKEQGDFGAARAIAERMKLDLEELRLIRELSFNARKGKSNSLKGRKRGPSPFKGLSRGPQEILTCPNCGKSGGAAGIRRYHFDNCGKPSPKKGKEHVNKRGTNSLKNKPKSQETREKMKKPKVVVKCPHCGLEGGVNAIKRWHFDNCKKLSI